MAIFSRLALAALFLSLQACTGNDDPNREVDAGVEEEVDSGVTVIGTLSVTGGEVMEGDGGTTALTFNVTLSAAVTNVVTVGYTTANGTADTTDFQTAAGTLQFAAGETAKSVSVSVLGDDVFEPDETFTLQLMNAAGGELGQASATGTIRNDDSLPSLSVSDVTAAEGTTNGGQLGFTVTLTNASSTNVTVQYATADGSATSADYLAANGTLSFAAGTTSLTLPVSLTGDSTDESDETVTMTLSNPTGATIANASAIGTIMDDDDGPTVSIADATVTEGDTGTVSVTFAVTLSAISARTVTMSWATAGLTATSGTDFVAGTGALTFAPGTTTQNVTVMVNGDEDIEAAETFAVALSTPNFATLARANATGTINNDDLPFPTLSIAAGSTQEGLAGSSPMGFLVTMSAAHNKVVTVDYGTVQGTASARGFSGLGGNDFVTTSGTLTFAIGETQRTITGYAIGDDVYEPDETYKMLLGNPTNATLLVSEAVGTVLNDEILPVLSITGGTTPEGNTASSIAYMLVFNSVSQEPVQVSWETFDITATVADEDYLPASGVLIIPPAATTFYVPIAVMGDTKPENYEQFGYRIMTPVGGQIGGNATSGHGIPNDDTGLPTLSISDATSIEGGSAQFTVSLSAVSGQTVTVRYSTSDFSATAPSDYTATTNALLTFNAGERVKIISVPVSDDLVAEAEKTFRVTLSSPTDSSIATPAFGTATIRDNDSGGPTLTINDVAVAEGDSGSVNASVAISLSPPPGVGQTVTVNFTTTSAGSAAAGADFTAQSGTLTFSEGVSTNTIVIPVTGDLRSELAETIVVSISNAAASSGPTPVIADAEGVVTINDNDPEPTMNIADATVAEGADAPFMVTLSAPSGKAVTVRYATSSGTATALGTGASGSLDYAPGMATITFAPGETAKAATVRTIDDVAYEPNETFTVTLSAASGASLAAGIATGTITSDEGAPAISIGDGSATEGKFGRSYAQFVLQIFPRPGLPITVNYTLAGVGATAGVDFEATNGTVTFEPGDSNRVIIVPVIGDKAVEGDETFTLTLSNATSPATFTKSVGQGLIVNDD